jgi:hypothetical protein
MNAKEKVLNLLKNEVSFFEANNAVPSELLQLITATENAIFDVPSEEEIAWEILAQCNCSYDEIIYRNAINFILNYKKP